MITSYNSEIYLPPTAEELSALVVEKLQGLTGHRLQEIELSTQFLALGFFGGGPLKWLVMDLRPKSCGVFHLSSDQRPRHKPEKKPLVLFLNSHARDHRLVAVEHQAELGRVVDLHFQHPDGLHVRLVLIPSQINVTATLGKKSLSLHKPREIEAAAHQASHRTAAARSPDELTAQWLKLFALKTKAVPAASPSSPSSASSSSAEAASADEKAYQELVLKKRRAIAKVEDELLRKNSAPYRELGDFLVQNQTLKVPDSMRALLNLKKNLAENIGAAYSKAKELEHKQTRTEQRLQQLRAELVALEKNPGKAAGRSQASGGSGSGAGATKKSKASGAAAYRARTLRLTEDLEFQVGKSAKDNLALLRQSRSWDFWLHVKDQPSSHGILFRPKNKPVTDDQLRAAAVFMLQNLKAGAADQMKGEKVEFLVAECRHVRPIKGDKLGRVTHHNARTLSVRM